MEWELVTSMEHLKKLCDRNGRAEFYILLAGGLCRSGKQIHYDSQTKKFEIYNEIDETWQRNLTEKSLYKKTMIPEAIEKAAMYYCGVQLWGIE
jgi:ribosomal protein S26